MTPKHAPRAARPAPLAAHYADVRAASLALAVLGYPTMPETDALFDAIGARIFYGAKPKVPFEAASGAQAAPKVDFNTAS